MIGKAPKTYVLQYAPTTDNGHHAKSNPLSLINGIKDIQSYRMLYHQIGSEWGWGRQSNWTATQWMEHLHNLDTQGWIMIQAGIPSGIFELRRHPDESVEIYYFGLTKALQGQGLGSSLLKCAVNAAQAMTSHSVWLKTSSTDHPAALRLYLQGGFKVVCIVQKGASLTGYKSSVLTQIL
jgi:ribosomal protein S18 acetylase RimI-like enzyme